MNIEKIIFEILIYSAQNWINYYVDNGPLREECICIRGSFITSNIIDLLLENGFKIDRIQSKRIDADAYYISPQINRAEKNKSYFYNCYGKEEKFYIENQG